MPNYTILEELATQADAKATALTDTLRILKRGTITSDGPALTVGQVDSLLASAKIIHQDLRDVVNKIQTEINKP